MKTKSAILKRFEQLMKREYSPSTIRSYIKYTSDFLDFVESVPMRVTNEDVLDYNVHIVERSDSYRNGALNAIKCYFKLILRRELKGYVDIRPRKKKAIVKGVDYEFAQDKILAIKNTKHRLLLAFGLFLGLRNNETRSILISDIDVRNSTILVRGKGAKQRVLPLPDFIIFWLYDYIEYYDPKEYLFNGGGDRLKYSASSLRNLVRNYIGDYTYHNLRHGFGKFLYERTGNIKAVADFLGHSKIQTAIDYYVNSNVSHLAKIQKKLINNNIKTQKTPVNSVY